MKGTERQDGIEKRIIYERFGRGGDNDEEAWKSGDNKKIKENES